MVTHSVMSDSDLVLKRVPLGIEFRVRDNDYYRSASVVVGTGLWCSHHDLGVFWEEEDIRVDSRDRLVQEGNAILTWVQDSGNLDGGEHSGMDVVDSVSQVWVLVVGSGCLVDIDQLGIVREGNDCLEGTEDRLGSDPVGIECRE